MPNLPSISKASPRLNDILFRTNSLLDSITGAIPTSSTISASNTKPASPYNPGGTASGLMKPVAGFTLPRRKQGHICTACGVSFNGREELDRHFNLKPDHSPYADSRIRDESGASSSSRGDGRAAESTSSRHTQEQQRRRSVKKLPREQDDEAQNLGQPIQPSVDDKPKLGRKQSVSTSAPRDSESAPPVASSSRPHLTTSFSEAITQWPPPAGPSWLRGRAVSASASSSAFADASSSSTALPTPPSTGGGSWRFPRPSLKGKKSATATLSTDMIVYDTTAPPDDGAAAPATPSPQRTQRSNRAGGWTSFSGADDEDADAIVFHCLSRTSMRKAAAAPQPPVTASPTRRIAPAPIDRGVNLFSRNDDASSSRRTRNASENDVPPPYASIPPSSSGGAAHNRGRSLADLDIFVATTSGASSSSVDPAWNLGESRRRGTSRVAVSVVEHDPFDDAAAIAHGDGGLVWPLHLPPRTVGGETSMPRGRPPSSSAIPVRGRASTNPFLLPGSSMPILHPPPPPPPRRRTDSVHRDAGPISPPSYHHVPASSISRPGPEEGEEGGMGYVHPFFNVAQTERELPPLPRRSGSPASSSFDDDEEGEEEEGEEVFADPLPDLVDSERRAGEEEEEVVESPSDPGPATPGLPQMATDTEDSGATAAKVEPMPGAWLVEDVRLAASSIAAAR